MKTLITVISFLFLLSAPLVLADDEKKVLIVKSMSVPIIESHVELFQAQLQRTAKAQGLTYSINTINADGDRDLLRRKLGELTRAEDAPDLIVTSATMATQEVFNLLHQYPENTIPQVYFTVTDPWGAGVVDGISRISGVPYYLPSDIKMKLSKRLISPKLKMPFNIGFVHSSYPSAISDLKRVEAAAAEAGVGFYPLAVDYLPVGENLQPMLDLVKTKAKELDKVIDYWWLAKGPLGERPETVTALAEVSKKPVLYGNSLAAVERGSLFFAGVSDDESMRIAADLAVNHLLDRPYDPSSQAVIAQTYELFFNVKAAAEAGIIVPSDLLEIAVKNSGVVGR